MISRAMMRRIEALEADRLPPDDPAYILVRIVDGRRGAVAQDDDAFDVVSIGESSMMRAAGEALDALCRRAVALHGRASGVDVLFAARTAA